MHFVVRECFYIEIIKNWYILQSASAVLQQVSWRFCIACMLL